jgi:predicted HD phosphohydrolase
VTSQPPPTTGLRASAKSFVQQRLRALLDLPALEQHVEQNAGQIADLAASHHETRIRADAALGATDDDPPAPGAMSAAEVAFRSSAREIEARHERQTVDAVEALQRRYEQPLFGRVPVFDLIERLGTCVDPTDCRLFGTSQLTHVLQVIEAMDADGALTDDLLLAALVHDLGKLLLLTDEDPANVVCMNAPIGEYADGVGLDNVVMQWNHDQFAHSRLAGLVPDHLAWLVRHHSIDLDATRHLMDDRDRRYATEYLEVFAYYDHGSKSAYRLPRTSLDDYREIIDEAFPEPILF